MKGLQMGKMKAIAIELQAVADLMNYADKEEDIISSPSHYTQGEYEVFPVLQDWFPEDPLAWQVVKYMSRYKHKGTPVQDLMKAEYYLRKLIENVSHTN